MIIAVAASSKKIEARVSDVFGRAPYFLIFRDNKLIETIKNPFIFGGGGSGLSIIQMLKNKNVEMVIGNNVGPNVINALNEKGMLYKKYVGITVEEVISNCL